MLFHALFDERDIYTGELRLDLEGPLDAARLSSAAEALLRRHANLRAEFRTLSSGRSVQVIRRDVELPWREVTSDPPAEERFDLGRPPLVRFTLVRLGPRRHRLVIFSHHLLWDGRSAPILLHELFALYSGERLPFVRPDRAYLDWLSKRDTQVAEQVWREALSGLDGPTLLGPTRTPVEIPSPFTTQRDATDLSAMARVHGLTLSTVMRGLWALFLSTLTGRTDVVLGATVSGRPPGLAGVGVDGRAVHQHGSGAGPAELFVRMQAEQSALPDHQHLGLADIQRVSGHSTPFALIGPDVSVDTTERAP
ncbi:MAG TPA: condensation domain-containing protein [Amycolatopsis sp.]|uniref:condensation domain-containing protein n=1 Tax=Amycolatopsis sp. TaxID=37632 RepID=UPI002B498AB8|nr:condensation domain-containing protein [Amycolatopsis sp.]HKS49688.1 condensation domain-containing protein [Amycolatopsis sp.]